MNKKELNFFEDFTKFSFKELESNHLLNHKLDPSPSSLYKLKIVFF